MYAYFYNMNTRRHSRYSVDLVDEVPTAEPRPDDGEIAATVNALGSFEYVESVEHIRSTELPPVDDGWYEVFEVKTHVFGYDEPEDIEWKYVAAFIPNPDEEDD